MDNEVGHVSVHEYHTGRQSDDLVRGYAAVRAADPEVSRSLLAGETGEKFRIMGDTLRRPGAVVVEKIFETAHWINSNLRRFGLSPSMRQQQTPAEHFRRELSAIKPCDQTSGGVGDKQESSSMPRNMGLPCCLT